MKVGESLSVRLIGSMKGVFANRSFQAGNVVWDLSNGETIMHPTRTSIQVMGDVHVEDPRGAFVNHSCRPTCVVDGWNIVAIKDIAGSDEITFDYSQNEDMMASPFVCRCCGRLINGKV